MAKTDQTDHKFAFNVERLRAAVELLPYLAGRSLNVLTEEDKQKQAVYCRRAVEWVDEMWRAVLEAQS